jgi:hypothetical protein
VADTFDALTSTRSYRPAATHKRALDVLRKEAGTQLDGAAVSAFLRTYSGRRPAALSSLVTLGPQRLLAMTSHQAGAVAGLAPAAGWIAPVAAAAAAVFGVSHGVDATTRQPVPPATTTAAVRATPPARTAVVVASKPVAARSHRGKAPASVKARRPTPHRHDSSPHAPGTTTPLPAAATTTTGGSPAPTSYNAPSPADAASGVRDVVAAVSLPAAPSLTIPALRADVAPVVQTVAAVSGAITATLDAEVANVTPVVTTLLPPKH